MLIPKTKLCETARIINNYYKQNTHTLTHLQEDKDDGEREEIPEKSVK